MHRQLDQMFIKFHRDVSIVNPNLTPKMSYRILKRPPFPLNCTDRKSEQTPAETTFRDEDVLGAQREYYVVVKN